MNKRKILNVVGKVIQFNTRVQIAALKPFVKKYRQFFAENVNKGMEDDKFWSSTYFLPFDLNSIPVTDLKSNDKFAIILQGPIMMDNDFTCMTIKYYQRQYANAKIVVSTWSDEPAESLECIRRMNGGVELVLNDKPENPGFLNRNFQIVSSLGGCKRAAELGYDFIVKTRTDQCVKKRFVFSGILKLIKMFPTGDRERQKGRIFLTSNGDSIFFPYFLSDFVYAGYKEDMINLFSIPLESRSKVTLPERCTVKEFSELRYSPEIYILSLYLESMGHKCDYTVADYWECVKKYLLCVEKSSLEIVHLKYDYKYERNYYDNEFFFEDRKELPKTYQFDFYTWLGIYDGALKYKKGYETYIEREWR